MKGFLRNIGLLLIIWLGWQVLGEYAYTYIYNHGSPRNKVMWVRSLEETKMDYAILGSSRAKYHLNPVLIDSITGLTGYNFGYENTFPFEINLLSRELLERTSPDRLFVQVDYTYNMDSPDVEASIPWIPYLKEDHIFRAFEPHDDIYSWFRNVPFYRYQYFEGELGFRNVILSALGKQPDFYANGGFKPIHQKFPDIAPFEYFMQDTENQSLKSLKEYSQERGVETVFFIAPILDFKGNMPIIKNHIPDVLDYTDLYDDPQLFTDAVHLMAPGAKQFTLKFTQDVFQK